MPLFPHLVDYILTYIGSDYVLTIMNGEKSLICLYFSDIQRY